MESSSSMMMQESSKLSPGASARKLKQSRLPFQILSASTKAFDEPVEARKRKPSTEGIDLGHVAKAGRISDVKENVTSMVTEENGKQRVEELNETGTNAEKASSEPFFESSRRSMPPANKAKKGVRKGVIKESPKILIKLPIGQRKRSLDKMKAMKRKAYKEEMLRFEETSNDVSILDDTDLSEDGVSEEEKKKTDELHEDKKDPQNNCVNVKLVTKANLVLQPTDKEIKTLEPEAGDRRVSTSDEKHLNNSMDSSLAILDERDGKMIENIHLAKVCKTTTTSDQKLIKPCSIKEADTSSDVDSSEEDIYMLCTPDSKIVPNEDGNKARKLTPKQIARRQEHEKRRALKQKEKEEKRRKLQEEKEEKVREKEEQERLRRKEREEKDELKRKEREEKEEMKRKDREEREEQKRKEREEKEEQKRKEREEREKKRQVEIEQKNEEKRIKEEERRKKEEQKEEDRKRKEEEKEAEEKRKLKVAQAFTSFFVKKSAAGSGVKASDDENSVESCSGGIANTTSIIVEQQRFMPFCVKGDMRLAPTVRRVLDSYQKAALDMVVNIASENQTIDRTNLYVEMIKRRTHEPLKSDRTWNVEDDEDNDEIMIVDENVCHQIEKDPGKLKQKFKTKFFLFEENRRPPYRGTWRKRSSCIKPRRPFAQDNKFFDYEVDSDDEWEEEEPGESLHGSDDEKDVDPEEDYEVDNEFFVPHGHLSDEELHAEEEGGMDNNSPEVQKVKLKLMQQEFVAEMKKKTEKIKPRLIGCIWTNVFGDKKTNSSECSAIIRKMLDDRAMLYNPDEPISFTRASSKMNGNNIDQDSTTVSPSKDIDKPALKKVRLITDDAIRELVRLVHGNVNNRNFLAREFHAFWISLNNSVEFSRQSISNKIKEIARWEACRIKGSMEGKFCWIVEANVLEQYKLNDLTLPNVWKYHLQKESGIKLEKPKTTLKHVDPMAHTQMNASNDINGTTKQSKEDLNCSLKTTVNSSLKTTVLAKTASIAKFAKIMRKAQLDKTFSEVDGKSQKAVTHASTHEKSTGSQDNHASEAMPKSSSTEFLTDKKTKKRVQLLMSVPRGQNINQSTKNNLISQFLSRENRKKESSANASVDTVIEID
uniref:Chromatin assembly factor 1 subunit A dimerization domain-containing protein n=1 Tax=Anopheles epiroticus TaxID=199890 RepID=A0A182PR41_9DIPT